MRVLHVIPSIAARYGGPSQAIVEMCGALQGAGIRPLVATTDADGEGRLTLAHGRLVDHHGVPTIAFPRQWSEAFKYSRPLADWLRESVSNFDVVHIHAVFSHASLAAAGACRRHAVPYVVRPLGSLDPWSLRQKPWRKRLFWHLGIKRMLHSAAAIHYTADEEQHQAESALRLNRGVVIPLGINNEVLHRDIRPDEFRAQHPELARHPYVLVLSRLHPKKGIELALDAFLAATRAHDLSNWRLVIAGDGEPEYVAQLRARTSALGSADRVLFTGWLGGTQKISALRGAALMTLPSYQENFGISVVEALASGVPALVSPYVNVAREIEAAQAGWVVPLEPAALETAFGSILRGDEERSRRGSAGRRLVLERYTWPAVAEQLVDLYERLGHAA